MTLRSLTDQKLVTQLKGLVTEERRIAAEVLEHLAEVDRRRLYADFGCASLWEFCTRELSYSGGAAYRRIAAMRLSREIPEVKSDLREGRQNLSSLAQVQAFLRVERKSGPVSPERKRAVLAAVQEKSLRECEKTLLQLSSNPQAIALGERTRVLDQNRIELKVVIDEMVMEKLNRIRALRSHASPSMSHAELISFMADEVLKRLESRLVRDSRPESSDAPVLSAPEVKLAFRRTSVPQSIIRQVWTRDRSRCSWLSPRTGERCKSSYFIEIDHIRPVAEGGGNSFDNLRLLCRAHNQRRAIPARN